MSSTRIRWEIGTAYDFFVSLEVLHDPGTYGVRGVWAAGMRSRLPQADREFLETVVGKVLPIPFTWLLNLPAPKDGAALLRTLSDMPAETRLPALAGKAYREGLLGDVLQDVAARGAWDDEDVDALRDALRERFSKKRYKVSRKDTESILTWWADLESFGERYYKALEAYYEVFFAEEERRIFPALQQAVAHGQELAEKLDVPALIEELSQGVTFSPAAGLSELILAPSFWSSPLIYWHEMDAERMLMLYGGRPADASLVPGEVVPDSLVRALKALSDPTRLKIMHYLSIQSLTPTQLSHRLRLRAPTVVHHLQTLRVAGLVQVTVAEGKERSYALRGGTVAETCEALQRFINEGVPEVEG